MACYGVRGWDLHLQIVRDAATHPNTTHTQPPHEHSQNRHAEDGPRQEGEGPSRCGPGTPVSNFSPCHFSLSRQPTTQVIFCRHESHEPQHTVDAATPPPTTSLPLKTRSCRSRRGRGTVAGRRPSGSRGLIFRKWPFGPVWVKKPAPGIQVPRRPGGTDDHRNTSLTYNKT